MHESLLKTKLTIPPCKAGLVRRDDIIRRLEDGLLVENGFTRKLTLICAPAGFGKTTLVRHWIQCSSLRFGRLSIDPEDDTPLRFWMYFSELLNGICDTIRPETLSSLSAPQLGEHETETLDDFRRYERFLTMLLNDVLANETPGVAVLDDTHVLKNPSIQRGMNFVLRNLPPNLHIVAVCRVEPDWALSRLRSAGELLEIGQSELRFSHDEIATFFRETMDYPLPDDDVRALEMDSEGWIAGLQLAAVSLRTRGSRANRLSLRGTHRLLQEYFSDEVIETLPDELQGFLLSTSILNRMCAPLCQAVTETADAQAVLERLERENYFVAALDEEGYWFRYHALFQQSLRARLESGYAEILPKLHRRAAQWYHENEFPVEAVRHVLAADDPARAAEIIESELQGFWKGGYSHELRSMLELLPAEVLDTRPSLQVLSAYFLLLAGKREAARGYIARAEELLAEQAPGTEREFVEGFLATCKAAAAAFDNDIPTLIQTAAVALEKIPPNYPSWRGLACSVAGDAAFYRGDAEAALRTYQEACDLGQDPQGNAYFALVAGTKFARLLLYREGTHASEELCRRMLALAEEHGHATSERAAGYFGLLGQISSERGEAEAAVELCQKGIAIAEETQILLVWCWCVAHILRPLVILGRYAEAHDWIRRARPVLAEAAAPIFESLIMGWYMRLLLAEGNLDEAADLLKERGLLDAESVGFLREEESGALIRYLLITKQHERAAALLEGYLQEAQKLGMAAFSAELEYLLAAAHLGSGRTEEAQVLLRSALRTGRKAGYRRMFMDDSDISMTLLEEAQRHGIEPDFCGSMLEELRQEATAAETAPDGAAVTHGARPRAAAAGESLHDALSERESELLQLIADGLSNQEIADTLFISLSTVKWHSANIYAKLGVEKRTQAAAKARRLGLVGD
ncbi:MAG: hypothetical protein EA428_01715 [Spirochaetaceae bacterium]|nr:MAG: hypothetical protein EA428_01715 [Spirochaetaceae bacterium]